jgi:hypothetical protein
MNFTVQFYQKYDHPVCHLMTPVAVPLVKVTIFSWPIWQQEQD